MTAAFSLGIFPGAMTDLVVAPGVSPANGRGSNEMVTTGGNRHYQRGRKNPRTWSVSRPWQTPEFARLLGLAAHGLGGDMLLYDRAVARQNLIPASRAVGDGAAVTVAGMSLGAVTWKTLTVPVLAGRTYTVSAWAASGSPLTMTTPGGTAVPLPAVSGGVSTRMFNAASTGHLTLARTTQITSGVRVHEGLPDGTFYATEGTPTTVAVRDPERTYQLVTDTDTRIDYTVELLEVGTYPGTITF